MRYNGNMEVCTLTLNPCLDRTLWVEAFGLPAKREEWQTGGKGVNVARVLAALGGIVLAGSLTGGLKWWYYPAPGGAAGAQAAVWTAAFTLLAAFPLIFDAKEAIQWRASRSRT